MPALSSLDVLTIHAKLSLRHVVSLQLRLFSIVQSSSRSAIVCSIDISPRPESRFRQDAVPSVLFLGARGRQPPSRVRAHSPRGQSRDSGTSQRPFVEQRAVAKIEEGKLGSQFSSKKEFHAVCFIRNTVKLRLVFL